jgi:predicted  nucleic acid-binding Zn-ribbon protein
MADSALGSALVIPESALKKIKEADDKLQKLQDTAKNTASSVTQSFKDMSVGTKPFLNSLDQVIAKLATINASASNASSGISNVGASAGNMNNNITSAAQNIQNMVAQLSKMNGSGTSGIMQAALAFQRLQESAKGASGMNIAELKQEIGSIESMLRDTTQNLTKADQDALIKRKKSLQDELRYQQQMYNERAVAFQKALDKMVSAEQSYNNKQRKAYADRAKDYQTRNNKANTTYQGALDFSATANTLNRQVRAIEYLKEARMKLSQTDADYKRKLDILNAAIEQHNKNLKEAGVNSRALTEQTSYMAGYMSRWAQRMAFAFSVGSIKNFVEQIASVRGQFELSERSLEAILQNKPKADEIFNKTVELAVKSPFRIKDLVDYTRQLSAYRIESDKLYDTTKRLADVSAGLGVDMGRLILAYGQVKAAAYLRGSEVRQFTEAGINMYGELQQYFKEVKGEAYTTAQIVDMISKRKVTFEDVEAIFQRMTDKGGTFYNMQEIQAETLQGKISNLKDAFDVMLNDIGKANEDTMKGMVSWSTSMLNNWKTLAEIGKALIPILIALKANSMFAKTSIGQAFSQASGTGIVRYKALFVNSLNGMKKALKDFGGLVKSSLSGIGVGLAFYAVAEVITTVYDKISNYNENVRKAEEETIKAKGAIGALAGTYNDLANAATNTNGKLEGKDLEKNVEDRRTTLQKLIDAASKDGLTFKINVDSLDANQLNATFSKVEKEYKDFIDSIEVIRRNYDKNDAKNTWFTDGLDDDADDYKDAVIDALAKSSQMERVVANINANYKQATSTTKKYFDEIRAGQKDNESNIDYMTRMYELIKKINIAQGGSDYKMPSFIGTSQADFNDLIRAMNSVQDKAQELNSEFDAVFGDLRKKYSNNPIKIQGVIDRIAAERDWSQYERDLAYRHFGINVYIDRANMEKQVSWVDDYINDFFAKKKYGISLVVKEIDDDKAFEGFLGKGDQAAKAAKSWKEVEKRLAAVGKNSPTITVDDTIRKIFKAGEIGANQMVISVAKVRAKVRELKQAATQQALALGVNPFEVDAKKNRIKQDKAQRDILQERISLLKDMSSEYQRLIKYEGEEQATADIRKHFALAAKNVGMNINNFIPDRQTIAKKIEYLASQYKELGKRGSALRNATEIRLDIDEEYFKQQLDDAKNNAQEAFSQLDLFKNLKGEGLSDSIIKSMFGDLTSSFDDVRKSITDDFEAKWGKDQTKWGDDVAKEYTSQMQKLDKEIYQDQVNQAQELIKAYKQQLSDQLQLDKWYIEEKQKIQNNANISKNKDLQKQLQDNLDKQYASKTDTNSWKDFQNSDMYISIFENLDHTSNRVLTAMKARLEGLRSSLKNLTPEQLKQIVEQINKIDALLVERNPYSKIGKNFKEYLKFAKQRKKLEEEYIDATQKEQILKNDQSNANKDAENAEIAYNNAVRKYGVASKEAIQARILWDIDKERLRVITDQLVAQGKITEKQAEQIRNGQKLQKTLQQQVQTIGQNFSDAASSVTELFSALNDWGANIEMSDDLSEVVDGISKIGSSLEGIDITRPFSVVKGTIGVIGGIGKTLGGIFGWGTKDKKLQKQIENHQKAIEKLRERYSELKDAMDNAFDIERLAQYNDEMVKNLKTQNANLESMIKAEQDKKKTDNDKIEEYRKQIEANNKAIEEAEQSLTEQLGGFGTKANYKSAAEEFAKTWVDAYNEGSDALEALNDKFDEYIQNLIVKQATQRIVGKMVEPLLKKIDNAVEQGGEGGNNGLDLVKAELDDIMTTGKDKLKGVSDMLKSFVDGLGYKPKGSSNISALQQGIQSVTESTAQALESILNSLRYYVATQQADVRIIRDTLLEKLGNSINAITQDTSSSPVLIELRLQTTILTDIRDTLASCVKGGHKQGRNGIKVFMN